MINLKSKSEYCAIYEIESARSSLTNVYISTTNESRQIVNDPSICGLDYTQKLKTACINTLKQTKSFLPTLIQNSFSEKETCVLNILRGGLNFGLREALGESYGWNSHSSAFLSAQRARQNSNPEEWYITESSYQKVYLPEDSCIVFGDVVATGTSLEYALNELLDIARKQGQNIKALIFFTIGGPRSHEIIEAISLRAKAIFPSFEGSAVIYLEGCFSVATKTSNLSIKYTGTDLLRTDSVIAPELLDSQFENPCFPLERCTIYDAGSRAFWIPEYVEDVIDYWEKTHALALNGMTYCNLVKERFPEILEEVQFGLSFSEVDLKNLCEQQIVKLKNI